MNGLAGMLALMVAVSNAVGYALPTVGVKAVSLMTAIAVVCPCMRP